MAAHTFTLKPGALRRPAIAWPTVLLAVVSLALWAAVAYCGLRWSLPSWATLPLSTLAIYMAFTPMHDATHYSVSREHRWLNEAVGWLCSVPFIVVPHEMFRFLHLNHHKHTNDPELDPDHMEPTRALLVPTKIWGSMWTWVVYIMRHRDSIDASTAWRSVQYLCMNTWVLAVAVYHGFGFQLLQFWVFPTLVGTTILSVVFSYVPHHPATVTRSVNPYGCTSTVDGVFSVGSGDSSRLLTWLLLGQNFHSMHHLYPTIPFYTYAKVWHDHRDEFIRAGVPVVALLPSANDQRQ